MTDVRRSLLWLGPQPPDPVKRACTERDLLLTPIEHLPIPPAQLATAKGVIICWPLPAGPIADEAALVSLLTQADMHGAFAVVLGDVKAAPAIRAALLPHNLLRSARIQISAVRAIELIMRTPPAPSWREDVVIRGAEHLSDEEKTLLHRAFGHCSEVDLVRESNGSTKVFRAHAKLRASKAGPFALPFFVKLDKRRRIVKELDNYRECTTLHIPFNQRPNVELDRCALGFELGVIVGNYIEQSESLQEAVDRGAGIPALRSLFDSALAGWRRQAYAATNPVREEPLIHSMSGFLPSSYGGAWKANLARNAEEAKADFGGQKTPAELDGDLKLIPPMKHRVCLSHGDLHSQNVRVAAQTAFLIDFFQVGQGALMADPASIDVSLMVDAKGLTDDEWWGLAKRMYDLSQLRVLPPPARPEENGAALADALRCTRQVALSEQTTDMEYALAVALQLVKKACFRPKGAWRARRRIACYALAETLIAQILEATQKAT